MTLKELYTNLSKIIDDSYETNPDILDKPIVLNIAPDSDNSDELIRCGRFYGIGSVKEEGDYIFISNYLFGNY